MIISELLSIPDDEFVFTASRSGGPGGQNVNKVNTRATVRFDVANSPCLTDEIRNLLMERLGTRITAAGILQVSSRKYRTQGENRQAAEEHLAGIIRAALEPVPIRRKTRVPRAVRRERLETKKRRGTVKRTRAKVSPGDGG